MRATIDELIVRNAPSASIAEKVSAMCPGEPAISLSSVARHRKNHLASEWLARARAKSLAGMDDEDIDSLRKRENTNVYKLLILYRNQTDELIERAVKENDLAVASSLIGRRTALLEQMARVLDLLGPVGSTTINNNFLVSSEYLELRGMLMRVLNRPHNRALRDEILGEMAQLESKPAPEIVDAEVKEIAGGGETVTPDVEPPALAASELIEPEPLPAIDISGDAGSVPPALAQATTEGVSQSPTVAPALPAPVIKTGEAENGATAIKLAR